MKCETGFFTRLFGGSSENIKILYVFLFCFFIINGKIPLRTLIVNLPGFP